MKKWDLFLLKGFFYGLPIVVCFAVFAYFIDWQTVGQSYAYLKPLYDLGGLVLGLWMIISIALSVRMVFSSKFRESVLVKLTLIKERDEREVFLTGRAAKEVLLTSIAILIFLFCLSCFEVSLYRLPPDQIVDGKTRAISLGVKFELFDHATMKNSDGSLQKESILAYSGLPFSHSSVIFGLLIWQIISYNYSMKKLMK